MNSRILICRGVRQFSKTTLTAKLFSSRVGLVASIPLLHHSESVIIPKLSAPNLQSYRYKSKKKSKMAKKVDEDEDDDEDEEQEEEMKESTDSALPGEKERILKTAQLRVDKIMRLALQNSKLVDSALLEGKIRRNDEKVLKKSVEVQIDDILDLELGPDPKNPEFLKVNRVEILEIKEGVHSHVRVLVSKNLSIKPYAS